MDSCCGPDTADLVIDVENGKLQGKFDKSTFTGRRYCCFSGIPYAKPPVGDLRFRPPEPADSWNGVYDATYERSSCMQYNALLFIRHGDEDCLYLNVYTPAPPSKIADALPVMVYIHGGGFLFGSGSNHYYSPDYLIGHNIILVTINYRLNIFGFLNLGIEECPGNAGLKDQILALKWVQKNIRKFGGDSNNVTLFGESAGATSIHYLMMTPLTEGLFCKAILQSGTVSVPWAFTSDPLKIAFDVGRKAGYDGNNRLELIKHLKILSAGDLNRCVQLVLDLKQKECSAKCAVIAPSVETIAQGAVLPDHPVKLMKSIRQIPVIWGKNDLEGALYLIALPGSSLDKIKKDFSLILKDNFVVDRHLLPTLAQNVRNLYFGGKYFSSSTVAEFSQLYGDIFFYDLNGACTESLVQSNCPVYFYEFSFNGRINFLKMYTQMLNLNLAILSNLRGACHGDELCYLFFFKLALMYPPLGKDVKQMIKFMTTSWTNFARTGNPSTEHVEWKPSTADEICYLDINVKPEMKSGIFGGERMKKFYEVIDPVAQLRM